MRNTTMILSIITLLLGAWAAALWLPHFFNGKEEDGLSYGISEGLQLVRKADGRLVVEDVEGKEVFPIPLRGCTINTAFHNGKLLFREKSTGRDGYIDRTGVVTFGSLASVTLKKGGKEMPGSTMMETSNPSKEHTSPSPSERALRGETSIRSVSLATIAKTSPFYGEAAKILHGRLSETDARRRHVILNYCEHFRTAYTTKDIDFLRQVFSDDALIIVGNVVKSKAENDNVKGNDDKVTFALHSKKEYLERLSTVFKANKKVDVRFSDFQIMRHPTKDGIYGVTLRQRYKSDRYEDDGWLFLLWDFRNPSMPVIHVRTWQPSKTVADDDEAIGIGDFNLE